MRHLILARRLDDKDVWVNPEQLEHVGEVHVKVDNCLRLQRATMLTFASGRTITVCTPVDQILAQLASKTREAA